MRSHRSHIVPLSPALLVAAANAFVGVQEEERVHERDVHLCVTAEGNTNDDGSSNGHTTLRKMRTLREAEGHRFVRWAEMVRGGRWRREGAKPRATATAALRRWHIKGL